MPDSGPPQGPIKLVILPMPLPELGRAGLRHHLEKVHGPMVMSEPDVSKHFRSYVHHYAADHTDQAVDGLPDCDAVTIIRFGNFADMVASKASAAYRERIGPDEDNFRVIEGSRAMFADEREVLPGADDAPLKLFVFRRVDAVQEAQLGLWAGALEALRDRADICGVTTNQAQTVDGAFPFTQFDEIGLRSAQGLSGLLQDLTAQAGAILGFTDQRWVVAEPVRFL